ncbi:DUF1415 domain-containing protein [Rhodoferax lacus]|uniref:DUF1415 domain-containing protein n=1 Tax=Rhodoferax lacus TaxID=2184758 RepID=A0A3E1REY2_9BURK|nr:DUF1415 domain-containing protein [Rhodoferax lacus]RFO97927.1 DUF1415 domain-containing protein [Rhodoferax lacus]
MNIEQAARDALVIEDTRRWVQRAVIGLNLCPFAKAVEVKQQVRYAISTATGAKALLADLKRELLALVAADPQLVDTTLLIAPNGFFDFLEFNEVLARADKLLADLDLEGVLQIASLHPHYQFAGTEPDDITNCTNRAPYPTLHLLREDSVDRAVAAFPNPEAIFETNMQTLQRLGHEGWTALDLSARLKPEDMP